MEVFLSSHFSRAYRKLSLDIQRKATEHKKLFEIDPYNSVLHTHKLQGNKRERWSFSVTRDIRVIFCFEAENQVLFLDIGPHDDVY